MMTQGLGILEFILGNFRILCDEIPQSSWGMTQGLGILEFLVILPRNSSFCSGILDLGILEFLGKYFKKSLFH